MRLNLHIQLDNALFEKPNGPEIAKVLSNFANRVAYEHLPVGYFDSLVDSTGNTVGYAAVYAQYTDDE